LLENKMKVEREDGTMCTAELTPGKVTYIPPFWAHRSVNTSDVPLVFLWTCSVEAGHDYEGLRGQGMRQVVVERNGVPSVERRGASQLSSLTDVDDSQREGRPPCRPKFDFSSSSARREQSYRHPAQLPSRTLLAYLAWVGLDGLFVLVAAHIGAYQRR
jgi:hypothetical protein